MVLTPTDLMIYAFYGLDTISVRLKAQHFINELMLNSGATIIHLAPENFLPGLLETLAGGKSLFGTEQIIVLDTPSTDKVASEEIISKLDLLAESINQFVLIETTLSAPTKRHLGKYSNTVTEVKGDKKTEAFNIFSLTETLLRRDKKSFWLLLQEARRSGASSEEIIGILWWQLKAIRLSALSQTAAAAGLKPFVYNKAKAALSRFTQTELNQLSVSLLKVYHDGHAGRRELDTDLESWVLKL